MRLRRVRAMHVNCDAWTPPLWSIVFQINAFARTLSLFYCDAGFAYR
jgi:hypothetical protein